MMNPTAFIIDSFKLSWAAILIVIALLVWFCFSAAFYNGKKRRIGTLILILPLAVLFSAFIGRSVYWYSHQSGFHGYLDALKSTDLTAFSLLGILPGIVLACGIVRLLRLDKNLPGLLDCLSPGTASAVAILYLTCLYQPICRGKSIVTAPALLHLPVSFMNYNTQGEPEYRFASFFLGFLLMLVLSFVTASFYFRHRKEKGSTACFFLLFYSAAEFVIESTRYDAGYFPTNGFVSIIQIYAGSKEKMDESMLPSMARTSSFHGCHGIPGVLCTASRQLCIFPASSDVLKLLLHGTVPVIIGHKKSPCRTGRYPLTAKALFIFYR